MLDWTRVKWTEAGQIAELLEWDDMGPDALVPPERYFVQLMRQGHLSLATLFASQALPRYDAVAWSARVVRDFRRDQPVTGEDADALKAALLWVQDPSETRRRRAFEAAGQVRRPTAGRLAALAAFISGGSIAPVESAPIQPPRAAAGRFAAGAVLLAAMARSEPEQALADVLDPGGEIRRRLTDAQAT